ncbi:hypothetical protein ACVBE9_05765 [Eionea flava]
MSFSPINQRIRQYPTAFNALALRERILLLALSCCVLFFVWYVFVGSPLEKAIESAEKQRENLLTLSEKLVSSYALSKDNKDVERNIAIIDKRISSVQSKMTLIDREIKDFNQKTIPIDQIVLLLRDLLTANSQLSLESLKVYPSEIIRNDRGKEGSFEDAFEKSMIAMTLTGTYSSIFSYLKKMEELKWSVFWEDVEYSVVDYPMATITIQIYTLSIIEEERYASR